MNKKRNEIDRSLELMMEGYEALDEIPLEELEQRRIMSKIMARVEQERRTVEPERITGKAAAQVGKKHWRRSAAVACVAVMVLSTAVFGSTILDGGLADLLGGDGRSREIISEMGTLFEDQSQSINGYTVALRQMIHDRNGCYILFDVSQDDDGALEGGYYYFTRTTVGLPDITRSGWFLEQPEVHDDQSDSVTMVLHYDTNEKLSGKTLKLTFEDFFRYDEQGEPIILAEGEWIFEIPVDRKDHTQTFRLDQDVTFQRGETDKTITVKTLYLSPMSITIKTSNNYGSTDLREIEVKLKDGSLLEFRSGGYGTGGSLIGSDTQVDFLFERVIDPQEIKEIWFNGTKLEL